MMRTCKRCKTNEAAKHSLNCTKCNVRNENHNIKILSELQKNITLPVNNYYSDKIYGGLGCEWDKGVAGHLSNI